MGYGLAREPEVRSETFEVLAGVFGNTVGHFSRLVQEGCIARY